MRRKQLLGTVTEEVHSDLEHTVINFLLGAGRHVYVLASKDIIRSFG
jgi:hypothetical protein